MHAKVTSNLVQKIPYHKRSMLYVIRTRELNNLNRVIYNCDAKPPVYIRESGEEFITGVELQL